MTTNDVSASRSLAPTLSPASSATLLARLGASSIVRFVAVTAQFALLVLIVRSFSIESPAFARTFTVAFAGFILHHLVPRAQRLPFFVILSLTAIVTVCWSGNNPWLAAWLIGLGMLLIGMAHLPLPFTIRVLLMLTVGGAFIIFRAGRIDSPIPSLVWPLLGSMFMYRMIVYLYDLKAHAAPFDFWRATAYFFMLPNICFPLFPVVDYKTFCRSHYAEQDLIIYQRGVVWMFRGIVHLLLYRLLTHNFMLAIDEVVGIGQVAQYMLGMFMLYLYVSGSFHVIIGMMHMFGFALPETHHRFLLSSGFTDFWRRINIYWKDFIQKIIFYPVYFRTKRFGAKFALITATITAFVATWALHAYQTYWIRGTFPIKSQDIIFWILLGGGVLATVLWTSRSKRSSRLGKGRRSASSSIIKALCTVGMFVLICFLWSFWTSDSWAQWFTMLAQVGNVSWQSVSIILTVLVMIGVGSVWFGDTSGDRPDAGAAAATSSADQPYWRSAAVTGALCALTLLVGLRPNLLKPWPRAAHVMSQLQSFPTNVRDAGDRELGYYEELTNVGRISPELWDLYMDKPSSWLGLRDTVGIIHRHDMLDIELPPSMSIPFKGSVLTTNRWGMTDKEYDKIKPARTYRIVMVGASWTMSYGVENHQTFEALLEERLNRDHVDGRYSHFEILNFAVGGYGPFRKLRVLETKAFDFDPDAIFWVAGNEFNQALSDFRRAVGAAEKLPYDIMTRILREAKLDKSSSRMDFNRLKPRREELVSWAYERVLAECKRRGIKAFQVTHPHEETEDNRYSDDFQAKALGARMGFTVLDLYGAFESVIDRRTLAIAPWDGHPNPMGHRLIADKLYEQLLPHLEDMLREPEH